MASLGRSPTNPLLKSGFQTRDLHSPRAIRDTGPFNSPVSSLIKAKSAQSPSQLNILSTYSDSRKHEKARKSRPSRSRSSSVSEDEVIISDSRRTPARPSRPSRGESTHSSRKSIGPDSVGSAKDLENMEDIHYRKLSDETSHDIQTLNSTNNENLVSSGVYNELKQETSPRGAKIEEEQYSDEDVKKKQQQQQQQSELKLVAVQPEIIQNELKQLTIAHIEQPTFKNSDSEPQKTKSSNDFDDQDNVLNQVKITKNDNVQGNDARIEHTQDDNIIEKEKTVQSEQSQILSQKDVIKTNFSQIKQSAKKISSTQSNGNAHCTDKSNSVKQDKGFHCSSLESPLFHSPLVSFESNPFLTESKDSNPSENSKRKATKPQGSSSLNVEITFPKVEVMPRCASASHRSKKISHLSQQLWNTRHHRPEKMYTNGLDRESIPAKANLHENSDFLVRGVEKDEDLSNQRMKQEQNVDHLPKPPNSKNVLQDAPRLFQTETRFEPQGNLVLPHAISQLPIRQASSTSSLTALKSIGDKSSTKSIRSVGRSSSEIDEKRLVDEIYNCKQQNLVLIKDINRLKKMHEDFEKRTEQTLLDGEKVETILQNETKS